MFNANVVPTHIINLRINRMFLFWFEATAKGSQAKLEESVAIIRRSQDFLGSKVE